MEFITIVIVIIGAIVGPSVVVASVGFATTKALSRNPSASPVLFMGLLIMLIYNEAIVIISLLVFFQVFQKS